MSTLQQSEAVYGIESGSLVEALGRALEDRFADTPPVYDVVDPDALNALFDARPDGTPRVDGVVSFTYRDYAFAVDAVECEVRVDEE